MMALSKATGLGQADEKPAKQVRKENEMAIGQLRTKNL
jgi:hypothetical protein